MYLCVDICVFVLLSNSLHSSFILNFYCHNYSGDNLVCDKPLKLVSYLLFVYYLMQVAQVENGSPVDVAKSYMQALPPWASPSLRHSGSRTPSPMATDLFKDEKLFSVDGSSFPSAQVLFMVLV